MTDGAGYLLLAAALLSAIVGAYTSIALAGVVRRQGAQIDRLRQELESRPLYAAELRHLERRAVVDEVAADVARRN